MTVRLDAKHSLLAGMVLALAGIAGGCSDYESVTDLKPEGPPAVLQAFVRIRAAGTPLALAYGTHRDINRCTFDKECDEGLMCNTTAGDPQTSLSDHCIDPATGKQPGVDNAVTTAARMRLVVKELLKGDTLDQFYCACGTGCPADHKFSLTPTNCTNCGDNPTTTADDESGKCLDTNDDDFADQATLQPGIATISCGAALNYTTDVGDGFYYPNGNQLPTSTQGLNGLGPAIVLTINGTQLPSDSDCTVTLTDKPRDKDGQAFVAPEGGPITFHTEVLSVLASVPANAAKDVLTTTSKVTVTLSNPVKASTVTATSVKLAEMGGADVALKNAPTVAGAVISIEPAAALKAATTYVVTISATVSDNFNKTLPAAVTRTFTTK